MKYKYLFIFIFFSNFLNAQLKVSKDPVIDILIDYLSVVYEGIDFSNFVYIGIRRQKLYHIKEYSIANVYNISTSINGAGNNLNSFKTPLGLHEVSSKIGDNLPIGARFKYQTFTGEILKILHDSSNVKIHNDAITTRILTLNGLEYGFNTGNYTIDTKHRGIYIHGTPEEGLIGKAVSHGCVRMKNNEVVEFFDAVEVGCKVIFLNN